MRNSLANIQFHESQKQTLLGKMDYAENQLVDYCDEDIGS